MTKHKKTKPAPPSDALADSEQHDDLIILDGSSGHVYANPDPDQLAYFTQKREQFLAYERNLLASKDLPALTTDGQSIELSANIELPRELDSVLAYGADSIGLYRTEFLYLTQTDLPTEEEQYRAYRSILEQMSPRPVIMRTLDLGGDKLHTELSSSHEANPALGWRAIRLCLGNQAMFKVQLRALLRASTVGNLKLMFPMISQKHELQTALAVLDVVKIELQREHIAFDHDLEIG